MWLVRVPLLRKQYLFGVIVEEGEKDIGGGDLLIYPGSRACHH